MAHKKNSNVLTNRAAADAGSNVEWREESAHAEKSLIRSKVVSKAKANVKPLTVENLSHHDRLKPSQTSTQQDQTAPNERLEQAIVFLSEEDAHLRPGFDKELAEIEREILLQFPLQQVEYDSGLYAQVRSMVAVHNRRTASLKVDAGRTPTPTPVPFSSSDLPQKSKMVGRDPSIGHHEDHPPFTLESSPESYEFIKQFKSNTPRGRELRELDRHAFTAALQDPALVHQPLPTEGSMENRAIQRGRRRAALQTALQSLAATAVTDSDCGDCATPQEEALTASFPTVFTGLMTFETQDPESETTLALKQFQDLAVKLFSNIYYAGLCDIVPAWLAGKAILTPEGKALYHLFYNSHSGNRTPKKRVHLLVDPPLNEMMHIIDERDRYRYPAERQKDQSPLHNTLAKDQDHKPELRQMDYTLIQDRYRSVYAQWASMWAVVEKTDIPDGDNILSGRSNLDPHVRHELSQLQNLSHLLPYAFRKREVNKAEDDATRLYAYLLRHYEKEIRRDLVLATRVKPWSSSGGAASSTTAGPSSKPNTTANTGGSSSTPAAQGSGDGSSSSSSSDNGDGSGNGGGNGNGKPPPPNNGASNGGKEPGDGKGDKPLRPDQVQVQPSRQRTYPRVAEWGEIWHADFPPMFPFGETEYIRNIMSKQVTWDLAQELQPAKRATRRPSLFNLGGLLPIGQQVPSRRPDFVHVPYASKFKLPRINSRLRPQGLYEDGVLSKETVPLFDPDEELAGFEEANREQERDGERTSKGKGKEKEVAESKRKATEEGVEGVEASEKKKSRKRVRFERIEKRAPSPEIIIRRRQHTVSL